MKSYAYKMCVCVCVCVCVCALMGTDPFPCSESSSISWLNISLGEKAKTNYIRSSSYVLPSAYFIDA